MIGLTVTFHRNFGVNRILWLLLTISTSISGFSIFHDVGFGFSVLNQEYHQNTSQNSQEKSQPFTSDEEVLSFLRTAVVLDMKTIPEGVTGARKVTLERNGIRKAAVFRCIDEHPKKGSHRKTGIRDYYLYECAAYEVSKMLGLSFIPPVVEREINSEKGTLQVWIEGSMMEKECVEKGITPPDPDAWAFQKQRAVIFDTLIFNSDRHLGNVLVDSNWKLWCIDHTRAFRTFVHIRFKNKILYCPKKLWDNLRKLDEKSIKERLARYLTKEEIRTLEKRRKTLIKFINSRIKKQGEEHVIVNAPWESAR